ncbi:hypothetical protein V5O48_012896 [Marasmius crinis-equi]|uniref:BTB domain-containing protein n=1 Tax=Marasmius crinis-equi TaxID=585013 RepID=A0ABR3F1Q5_9AGAR
MELESSSNIDIGGGTQLTISYTFGPTNIVGTLRPPPDLVLLSRDSVVFYADEATLLQVSNNSFKSLLPLMTDDTSNRILFMQEIPSSELDFMLQAIYDVPGNVVPALTDIHTLLRAVDHLPVFGISPSTRISPTSYLYQYLESCAPLYPFEIYALAAQYNIETLAITISAHTLALELSQISEDLSKRMGPTYLLRLFHLHGGRTEALKRLLAAELEHHKTTDHCDYNGQKRLTKGWSLAVASMLFSIKPGQYKLCLPNRRTLTAASFPSQATSNTIIRDAIMEYTSELTCPDCIKVRDTRLARVISEWTLVSRTINP